MTDSSARHFDLAITGAAPICALGTGRAEFADAIRQAHSGISISERLADTGAYQQVAECWDFAVGDYLASKKTYLDRCSEFALAACALALQDAGLVAEDLDPTRLGLSLGTAFGCVESMTNHTARIQAKGLRFGSPMIFTHTMANSPTALAAIEYGIQGPLGTFSAGSISAACALEFATRRLRDVDADFVLVGGCDALSTPLLRGIPGSEQMGADFIPGEGAAVLVLERHQAAVERGAAVLAQVGPVGMAVATQAHPDAAVYAACRQVDLSDRPDVFSPPGSYGHAFGAAMALDLCAAIEQLQARPQASSIAVVGGMDPACPTGPSAAVLIRSAS